MAIYYVYWYRDDDAYVFEPKENSASDDYAYIEADSPEEAIKIAKSDIHINSKKMWYPDFNSFRAKEKLLEEVANEINSLEDYYPKDKDSESLKVLKEIKMKKLL